MNQTQLDHAVYIHNDQIKTDSLKVAEIFGKRHADIIRKIENLDCSPTFSSTHFCVHDQEVQIGKGATRESKYYEMTKDGFMFLTMGLTGAKAAQIKESYIHAFNHMAELLSKQHNQLQHLQIGTVVQLRSGSADLTLHSIHDDHADIIWFKNGKIHRETLPLACLTFAEPNYIAPAVQSIIEQFWETIFNHGINHYNHSNRTDQIALNLTQLYQQHPNLPKRSELLQILPQSKTPYPEFIGQNISVLSRIQRKSIRCWIFKSTQPTLIDVNHNTENHY